LLLLLVVNHILWAEEDDWLLCVPVW
jgi:hypothetical protein